MTETTKKLEGAKQLFTSLIYTEEQGDNYRNRFPHNLGAFLVAFSSVISFMEKEYKKGKNKPIFKAWFEEKINNDNKIQFLRGYRDITVHSENLSPVGHFTESKSSGYSSGTPWKITVITRKWYFTMPNLARDMKGFKNIPKSEFEDILKIDVITLCLEGLDKLEAIVSECEQKFGTDAGARRFEAYPLFP